MKAMSKLFYPFLSITRNPCSETRVPCVWLFIPPQASEFHLLCEISTVAKAMCIGFCAANSGSSHKVWPHS